MRRALITGAGAPGGIGFACARALGAAGCRVAIASTSDRIFQRQAELQALGYEVTAHIADLTDPGQVARLVAEVGPLDVLVNNAGLGSVTAPQPWGEFTGMAAAEWQGSFDTTFQPTLLMTRAYLPQMMAQGWGRVVQVGSVTGPIVAIAGASAYGAAKAAIVGLTHTLALEVAGSGVTVNIVAPGWVGTEALTGGESAAALASPMKRAGRPDEMAAAVVFLASDGASYVNGATIVVDGGNSLQEPLRGKKGSYYEGGIREPFIVHWPGVIQPGTRCDVPVINQDLYATFLAVAGANPPAGKIIDGESLVPLFRQSGPLRREAIFWHFPGYLDGPVTRGRDPVFRTRPVSVIHKGDWKLHLYHEEWQLDGGRARLETNNAVELYNLRQDIGERNNLALANTAKRDELLNDLLGWFKAVGAKLPEARNPEYAPNAAIPKKAKREKKAE